MNFHTRRFAVCFFLLGGFAAASQSGGIPAVQSGTPDVTPQLITPFELVKGHVLLSVDVNGEGPQWFVLDTGFNRDCLTLEAAQRMGLRTSRVREARNVGVGEGTARISSLKEEISLRLHGKEIADGKLPIVSLDDIEHVLGRPIGGVVGAPLFQKYVVEVDYSSHVLKLYDSKTYVYRGKGYVVPISVNIFPFVKATIVASGGESIGAVLEVDTGSDGALSLNSPFTFRYNLPWAAQVTIPVVGGGVGGRFRQREGRVKSLRLGNLAIGKPLVIFSEAESGLASTGSYDGDIGNSILERFTAIFDYSRKQMVLEPNALFGSPFVDNMSGLWLGPRTKGPNGDGRVEWLKAAPEGAAESAGLSEGDKVVAINGRAVKDFSIPALKQLLEEEGKTITLTIERGGKKMELTFTTPRLL